MDQRAIDFIEANASAGMTTLRKDGTAHTVRVGIGLFDGRLLSSGTQSRLRTKFLRRDPRTCAVRAVVVSGKGYAREHEEALSAGAEAFLLPLVPRLGFTPDLVATAWVGFDQERPLGANEEGARTALPMWIYFMREALAGLPERRLPMPDGVVTARVPMDSGGLGDAAATTSEFEYFLADHLPAGVAGATGEGVRNLPPAQKYEEPIF